MSPLEKVARVRVHTNRSPEECAYALNLMGWSILDAVTYLQEEERLNHVYSAVTPADIQTAAQSWAHLERIRRAREKREEQELEHRFGVDREDG